MKTIIVFIISFIVFTGFISEQPKRILFLGDSLTAGYGIDESDAFPALIQQKIDDVGLNYEVINGGLSGETTAGGLRRIDWMLRSSVDIMVLSLGANDGLRGIEPASTKENLQQIIDKVKAKNPDVQVIISGMMVPPNMGQRYADEFEAVFPKLAEDNNAGLIPFLLEGVAGEPELNLPDGIHPTEEGHEIVAENVWEVLRKYVSMGDLHWFKEMEEIE